MDLKICMSTRGIAARPPPRARARAGLAIRPTATRIRPNIEPRPRRPATRRRYYYI